MIFGELLGETTRDRIYKALRTKWFGDAPATTNYYNNLSLGAKAFMAVGNGGEAMSVTNKLTLAGSIEAICVSAEKLAIASANATVKGALTLPDGAILSFTLLPDGSWTSLSATSLAAEGAVTVSLSGCSLKGLDGTSARLIATDNPPASLGGWSTDITSPGTRPKLVLKEDGVWVEFVSPGMIMMVQ
jgi:hypothetical protein